jgi:superfamily I DNA and RNA helicase
MLDLVIGDKRNPLAANSLVDQLEQAELTGTLYLGYPILASFEQTVFIDALLTCLEHGVVVFDFSGIGESRESLEAARQKQDDLYTAVYQKLLSFPPLRRRRDLSVDVNVVTLTPDLRREIVRDDLFVVHHSKIRAFLDRFDGIPDSLLKGVNAAVQRVTTMKPAQRRAAVQRANSRGGVMKRIEHEIANLDQWQKRAAIETPEGPQRVRGLAGSGKTIVLALKAAYLHALKPDWRIAVTFHTRSLYQQFEDLIRRFSFEHLQDEPNWSRLDVLHAWGSVSGPGLYSKMAMANDIQSRDFLYAKNQYGYDEAFSGVCRELLNQLSNRTVEPLYDAILIDEAQDFPHSFFELTYLAVRQPKRIIWAYDELQNLGVYRMAPPSELFGKDANGQPRIAELRNEPGSPRQDLVLPVCYRNTPWALTIAHALGFGIYREDGLVQFFDDSHLWRDIGYEVTAGAITADERVELRRSPDSSPPYFSELLEPADAIQCYVWEDEDEQAQWLAQSIHTNVTQDELELRDILVIIADPLTAKKKAGRIVKALGQYEIPAHLAGVTTSRDVLFSDESIAVTGIYRAKGNEAPMVYLVNSDYGHSGFELIKRRNILFTAITRSRGWVRLSGCGSKMEALRDEVNKVVAENYRLKFRVPTPEELENLRRIHRDMTRKERARAEQIEGSLVDFATLVEQGDLSLKNLSPELRDRLGVLFQEGKDDDT